MAETTASQRNAASASIPSHPKQARKSLADDLLDLQEPATIKISPDSQQVVYSTGYFWGHQRYDHVTSILWLAETGKPQSSRQLTTGKFNDREPRWSADGRSIAFLSDRAKPGESCAIYILPLAAGSGEAYAITPESNEKNIPGFEFSPDGKTMALISADEKTEKKKEQEKGKDDAQVWGEWEFGRLRLVDLESKDITTLVEQDAHVVEFAWDDSGREIAFAAVETPDAESPFLDGTSISMVNVAEKTIVQVTHFPNQLVNLSWVGTNLFFRGPAAGGKSIVSSVMVYRIDLRQSSKHFEEHAQGKDDCAAGLAKAGGEIIVYVQHGVEDQISIAGGRILYSRSRALLAWDATFTKDSDEVILAVATGDVNNPTEVFSTTASGGALVRLSNHGERGGFAGHEWGSCEFLSCQSSDNKVALDGIWLAPATTPKPREPAPTVVLVHGGPYGRSTNEFCGYYFFWAPLLLAHGYHILLPNYRSGSGRGQDFAAYGQNGGKEDYEDVIALTQHAVETGLADKEHLVIAGYSQGGYMSFLAAVRNGLHDLGWKFRATIPGAGITDQDSMVFTSVEGCFQAELGGARPWCSEKTDTVARKGSAIWEVHNAVQKGNVIPPMLIMHGEQDTQVPVSQSIAMRRALKDHKLPFEMVIYPREDHIFKERGHMVDMAERMVKFVQKHI